MEKEFLKYEEALALKELGFNEKCYGYYTKYKEYFYFDVDNFSSHYTKNLDNLIVNSVDPLQCTAPLYQQAFRWFRDTHKLDKDIFQGNASKKWNAFIVKCPKEKDIADLGVLNTYEEAELACLKKLIEIVDSVGKK